MIVIISPQNHLSHLLDLFGVQLQLILSNCLSEIRNMKIFKGRVAGLCHRMVWIFIERVSQSLMTDVMSKGSNQHYDPFPMRELKFFLPSIRNQKLIKVLKIEKTIRPWHQNHEWGCDKVQGDTWMRSSWENFCVFLQGHRAMGCSNVSSKVDNFQAHIDREYTRLQWVEYQVVFEESYWIVILCSFELNIKSSR